MDRYAEEWAAVKADETFPAFHHWNLEGGTVAFSVDAIAALVPATCGVCAFPFPTTQVQL